MRQAVFIAVAALMFMALTVFHGGSAAAQSSVQALVLTDFGEHDAAVSVLDAQGWTVTTESSLDLGGEDPLSSYDVVWVPGQSGLSTILYLAEPLLHDFAKQGGVVVIAEATPEGEWEDIAPGGLVGNPLPLEGGGSITIAAADHPIVTGEGIGGLSLIDIDLDPDGLGSSGNLFEAPEGAVVIAQDGLGPVVVEYPLGDGYALVAALRSPTDSYTDNMLGHIETLIP